MYRDRSEAGIKLAEHLLPYRGADALVLALPRGGVEVGYEVAEALDAELDVLVVRKLGSPEGGMWITAECGPDVPLENIEAICRALEKYRGYYRQ